MIVDLHAHYIPPVVVADARAGSSPLGLRSDGETLVHPEGVRYPLAPTFLDSAARLAQLDALGLDAAVVSLAPTLFAYDQPPDVAIPFAQVANDALAELVGESERLAGIATLPLQDPGAAIAELERAVGTLGLRGAQLGTNPAGRTLDEPDYEPLLAAAQRLDVPLLLHPHFSGAKPGLGPYYLTNTIGNPVDTTIAAARLIHSGVLDRLPSLRLVLVHGGGFLPYQIGRLDRAHDQRSEPRVAISAPPSSYLGHFWMDSITHDDGALAFLRATIGDDRLVLGTDLPFDMADPDPVGRLRRVGLDADALGAAALQALGGSW